jgi:hypothetical protein
MNRLNPALLMALMTPGGGGAGEEMSCAYFLWPTVLQTHKQNQAWGFMPAIPALSRLRWEDHDFKASLGKSNGKTLFQKQKTNRGRRT